MVTESVSLNGSSLGVYRLVKYACAGDITFNLEQEAYQRILAAREVVDQAVEDGEPVYGLTTGLGSRVVEKLSSQNLQEFSIQTLRGRAHSLGEPMSVSLVRAAMIARLNTLAIGASGASPGVGDFIAKCLNHQLTPVIGSRGSIGASDLCWGATMGLAFCGEGMMVRAGDEPQPAAQVLKQLGMNPLQLKPKDGLVLANHSGFSSAMSAFSVYDASVLADATQCAAAMSMTAMRANLSPIDARVIEMGQHPGQKQAAQQLRTLLSCQDVPDNQGARKIQDPLSIRNIAQVHGALLDAIAFGRETVNAELNSSSDNPVVDIKNRRVVSSGGYYPANLTMAVECVARSISQMSVVQLARIGKILSHRFSGLPQFLAREEAASNGFAPIMKLAEALLGEIKMLTRGVDHWPSFNADGVEDIQSNAPLAAQSLTKAVALCRELCAIELIVAAQAIDLADINSSVPAPIANIHTEIRNSVQPLLHDRPMGEDIRVIAGRIQKGDLPGIGKRK